MSNETEGHVGAVKNMESATVKDATVDSGDLFAVAEKHLGTLTLKEMYDLRAKTVESLKTKVTEVMTLELKEKFNKKGQMHKIIELSFKDFINAFACGFAMPTMKESFYLEVAELMVETKYYVVCC